MNPEQALQYIEDVLSHYQPTDSYDEMRLRNAHAAVRYICNWVPPFNEPKNDE